MESKSELVCQNCGHPREAHSNPALPCRAEDWGDVNLWNAEQFRARNEAIDRIVLAFVAVFDTVGDLVQINESAGRWHDATLARRRAEAAKLMEGGK